MQFEKITRLPEGQHRTACLCAWFQSLFSEDHRPVLVGGAAVELYTGGAYTTGDLDFVGTVPNDVAEELIAAGFKRSRRYWVHDEAQVFIELPSSSLKRGERAALLQVGDLEVQIVGPEELVIDRLGAWQSWRSEQDAINAYLIWRSTKLSMQRLRSLAVVSEVEPAVRSLVGFRDGLGSAEPTPAQLKDWTGSLAR